MEVPRRLGARTVLKGDTAIALARQQQNVRAVPGAAPLSLQHGTVSGHRLRLLSNKCGCVPALCLVCGGRIGAEQPLRRYRITQNNANLRAQIDIPVRWAQAEPARTSA